MVYYHSMHSCIELTSIDEASTTLAGSDCIGPVIGSHIKLSANITPIFMPLVHPNIKPGSVYLYREHDYFDDGLGPDRNGWTPENLFLLVMAFIRSHEYWTSDDHGTSPAFFQGLILEEVKSESKTYKRVGFFKYPTGPLLGRYASIDATHYPEFSSFDMNNFEWQTVTII